MGEINIEELLTKAKQERSKAENGHNRICEKFMNDIQAYLMSKFPNMLLHETQEAAAFAAERFIVSMYDSLAERDREWKAAYRRKKVPITHYEEEE